MARTLVLIVSSAIKIVELEAYSEFLSRVHCKQNLQVLLAVGTVALLNDTFVIGERVLVK